MLIYTHKLRFFAWSYLRSRRYAEVSICYLCLLLGNPSVSVAHGVKLENAVDHTINSVVVVSVKPKKRKNSSEQTEDILKLPNGLESDAIKEFYNELVDKEVVVKGTRIGSGVIISSTGLVATSHHLVKKAKKIEVSIYKGKSFNARLVAFDDRSDVAILQIKANNLIALEFASFTELRMGQPTYTIGAPFGYDYSVSSGIISAVGSRDNILGGLPVIQSDIAVNPGNSGGPLFNRDGKLLGIISRIVSTVGAHQGVSFAVPIEQVIQVYKSRPQQNTTEGGND